MRGETFRGKAVKVSFQAYYRRRQRPVARKRIWAVMRAKGLVLAPTREPKESVRGGQVVADSKRR